MADINTGPVTARELLRIAEGAPAEIAGRIRRAADQLAAFDCPPTGAGRIFAERLRQVREKGFHYLADDSYRSQQLARAAVCYALPYQDSRRLGPTEDGIPPLEWPWPAVAWRPGQGVWIDGHVRLSIDDRVRELEKAGALCAAEIDRLVRLQVEGGEFI